MITLAILGLDTLTPVDWAVIVAVLALSFIALSVYTWILYQRVPKDSTPLIGQHATVVAWDGRDQRIEVFGAIWQAALLPADCHKHVKPGDIVRVCAIDNLVLIVSKL